VFDYVKKINSKFNIFFIFLSLLIEREMKFNGYKIKNDENWKKGSTFINYFK